MHLINVKQTRVQIRLDKGRKQIMTKDAFIREVRDAEAMLYHNSANSDRDHQKQAFPGERVFNLIR